MGVVKREMILSLQNFSPSPLSLYPYRFYNVWVCMIYICVISSAALCPTYHPQPIILIGSHRSPSSFLATDSEPLHRHSFTLSPFTPNLFNNKLFLIYEKSIKFIFKL